MHKTKSKPNFLIIRDNQTLHCSCSSMGSKIHKLFHMSKALPFKFDKILCTNDYMIITTTSIKSKFNILKICDLSKAMINQTQIIFNISFSQFKKLE